MEDPWGWAAQVSPALSTYMCALQPGLRSSGEPLSRGLSLHLVAQDANVLILSISEKREQFIKAHHTDISPRERGMMEHNPHSLRAAAAEDGAQRAFETAQWFIQFTAVGYTPCCPSPDLTG